MPKGEGNVVAQNKKARHDYNIIDTIEAGIVLTGTEIKSVRAARIQLTRATLKLKTEKLGSLMSTFLLLSKGISGIKTPTALENYC